MTAAPHPIDPALVPVYPLLRAEVRRGHGGLLEGLVDDQLVAASPEFEVVRAEIVAAAARQAGRRQGPVRAIRVRAVAFGSVFHLVVTADGEVVEAAPPVQAARAAGAAGKPRRGRCRWWVVAGAVAAAALVTGGVVVGADHAGGHRAGPRPVTLSVPEAPAASQLPVVAPAPYAAAARWAVPLGAPAAAAGARTVAADTARVYAVASTDHVAAFLAGTGERAWSRGVDGVVQVGPALTRVDGATVVAAATSDRLYLLSPTSGAPVGSWPIPVTAAAVQVTATGPVVTVDSRHVLVVDRGLLVSRVLPAAGVPVGPTTAGGLVAVGGSGQVWTVRTPQLAGDPVSLAAPPGTSLLQAAGWTGAELVVAFVKAGAASDTQLQLRSYAPRFWQPQWTTGWIPAATAGASLASALVAAPSGDWGIYGTTAVDLHTGRTVALPSDWQTTAVGDQVAFGTGAGRPLAATAAGVTPVSLGAPVPTTVPGAAVSQLVAPQAVSGSAAYLVADDGAGAVLYALRLPADATVLGPVAGGSSGAGAPR